MNKKKLRDMEEKMKDMKPDDAMEYMQFMTLLDKATSVDWGAIFLIVGLSMMAISYFLKLLVDFGVIPDF